MGPRATSERAAAYLEATGLRQETDVSDFRGLRLCVGCLLPEAAARLTLLLGG